MSAYAAVISLQNTIHHILHSCRLRFVHPSLQIIQVAYDELQPWKEILERLDESSKSKSRKKVNALDGGIKETLRNFEDLLESILSHQIALQSGCKGEREREREGERDLQSLQDDADSFIQTLKITSFDFSIKTCRLHSAWRHLCRGEARKNKFYHVLNRIADAEEASIIQGQRCLCLANNLLFGIKEFCNSVRCSNCASTTRSLLFFGPYHQYPTPIDAIGFKLLRELNALQLRFYTFPTEILTLVLLKYLALTCNGQLPSTISKLFNLKLLIIHPHTSITKCYDSFIPIEIWDMKELEHIEILGKSFLVAPPNYDVVANPLEKVSTVVGVNAGSICTITKRIPNVRKLGVQMEVTPYDDVDYSSELILSCFPHISTLEGLETLKCSIINPVLKYRYVAPSSSCSSLMFPPWLRKLHLSGMGFPWEYMDAIGSLPHLEVLKLRSYAFRGSKWEARGGSFWRLKYLVIEDSDLVEWKPASGSFLRLCYLSLKHCYKLKELHWPFDSLEGKIELVNCNPLGVACSKKLQREGIDTF